MTGPAAGRRLLAALTPSAGHSDIPPNEAPERPGPPFFGPNYRQHLVTAAVGHDEVHEEDVDLAEVLAVDLDPGVDTDRGQDDVMEVAQLPREVSGSS